MSIKTIGGPYELILTDNGFLRDGLKIHLLNLDSNFKVQAIYFIRIFGLTRIN